MKHEDIRIIMFKTDLLRRQFLKPYYLEMGLTVGQGQPRILKNLLEHGKMTQKALAEVCGLDVTTMSRTLDKLEAMGLLVRENNPNCRRSYLISLTPDGEKKAVQVSGVFKRLEDVMCRDIPEEELEAFYKTMEKIEANLR